MDRTTATLALAATLALPLASHATPKDLAVHFAVPGLSVTYVNPGFRVAVPVYPAQPVYGPAAVYRPTVVYPAAPVAYPVHRPAYTVVVHPGHGHHRYGWAHRGHPHPFAHPGRHGHHGHRGHWR